MENTRHVTLRVLSERSVLGVGPYAKETVGKLIGCRMYRHLRRIYYTYETIDFCEDVRRAINITHPIPKPGTARDMVKVNDEEMLGRMGGGLRNAMLRNIENNRAIEHRLQARRESRMFSRSMLQRANHGKTTITFQNNAI